MLQFSRPPTGLPWLVTGGWVSTDWLGRAMAGDSPGCPASSWGPRTRAPPAGSSAWARRCSLPTARSPLHGVGASPAPGGWGSPLPQRRTGRIPAAKSRKTSVCTRVCVHVSRNVSCIWLFPSQRKSHSKVNGRVPISRERGISSFLLNVSS